MQATLILHLEPPFPQQAKAFDREKRRDRRGRGWLCSDPLFVQRKRLALRMKDGNDFKRELKATGRAEATSHQPTDKQPLRESRKQKKPSPTYWVAISPWRSSLPKIARKALRREGRGKTGKRNARGYKARPAIQGCAGGTCKLLRPHFAAWRGNCPSRSVYRGELSQPFKWCSLLLF